MLAFSRPLGLVLRDDICEKAIQQRPKHGTLAPGEREPFLPGWRIDIGWSPIGMNEDIVLEIGNSLQPSSRRKQLGAADWPKGISQEFMRDAIHWRFAASGIAYRDIGIAGA